MMAAACLVSGAANIAKWREPDQLRVNAAFVGPRLRPHESWKEWLLGDGAQLLPILGWCHPRPYAETPLQRPHICKAKQTRHIRHTQ
jgi:hypothetical protein|tara:strand:+ start:52698 stop:52958 length:261 start_codon:yes stop_codon:yes gene_type:complete